MFDLYQAPATAAHHQADLYAEIAADRLARAASNAIRRRPVTASPPSAA